jgi:acyl-CoA synthetase (AMP-forming)/AMP-acid ligase II
VPEVQTAAAIVQDAGKPSAVLIAYVEPATVSPDAVTAACAQRLPHYMVPSAVLCLDIIPRLANGKASVNS